MCAAVKCRHRKLKVENGKCEVYINDKKIIADGFIDTGNKLYDNITGLPVIVASKSFIKKLCEVYGTLDSCYTYRLTGKIVRTHNMAVFSLETLTPVEM